MKRTAGMTMVELIVASCIALILTVSLVTVLVPVYRTYQRTLDHADAQLIAGNVLDTLRAGARTASAIVAGEGTLDIGKGVYSVQDGHLYFDDNAIFASRYYGGKSVALTCSQNGHNAANVTVTVSGRGGQLAEISSVIMPLRSVLDNDKSTPLGMQDLAQQVKDDYQGGSTRPDQALFDNLYNTQYGSSWPVYDVTQIMTVDKLTALRDSKPQTGARPQYNYYNSLLSGANGGKTFYLATYFTRGTQIPVVYLTDSDPSLFSRQAHGNTYMIYYEGNWYVPASETSGFYMVDATLNAFTSVTQLEDWLNDTSSWLDASRVSASSTP